MGAAIEGTMTARSGMLPRGARPALALLVSVVALLALAAPAQATFPGLNGKIAFQSNVDGDYEVYTMNPDGTGLTKLTDNTTYDGQPDWSPDGRKIAFTRREGGDYEIFSMNANGSAQQNLTNNEPVEVGLYYADDFDPSWSPDGTKITFTSNRDYEEASFDQNRTWTYDVYVMSATGASQQNFSDTSPPISHCEDNYYPEWSPSGEWIAYQTTAWSGWDPDEEPPCPEGLPGGIQLQSPPGAPFAFEDTNVGSYFGFEWTPAGQTIVFSRTTSSSWDIHEAQMPFGSVTSLANTPGIEKQVAPSPDDIKVAFVGGTYFYSCYLSCFTGCYPNCVNHIYTMNRDGSGLTMLINNGASNEFPDWQSLKPPGYARPLAASPSTIRLVPAYRSCTSPNAGHGAPLANGSCSPATQVSEYLTVGLPGAPGGGSSSTGQVKFRVVCNPPAPNPFPECPDPGDQIDVELNASLTDVFTKTPPLDYSGELRATVLLRITDRYNGTGGVHPATVTDTPFSFNLSCQPTTDPQTGSNCSAATTADAVLPGIAREMKRAIWELGQIQVYDGGADGDADTVGDNTLFAVQGIFAP